MANELNEWFLHHLSQLSPRSKNVCDGKEWKQKSNENDLKCLNDNIFPPKSWKAFIPKIKGKIEKLIN